MEVQSLESLLKTDIEESEVYDYLSSFTCEKNPDVESFLHKTAINNEKQSFSRTFLVVDEKNNYEIIGYFTLLIKNFTFNNVSGTTRKRLTGNKKATSFMTILIAQLGRSDKYKGKVPGKIILDLALEKCLDVNLTVAVKVACVEYKNTPKLCDFYEKNGFTPLQINDNGYIISYVKLY